MDTWGRVLKSISSGSSEEVNSSLHLRSWGSSLRSTSAYTMDVAAPIYFSLHKMIVSCDYGKFIMIDAKHKICLLDISEPAASKRWQILE